MPTTAPNSAVRDGVGAALLWCGPGLGLTILLGMAMSGPSGTEVDPNLAQWGRLAAAVSVTFAVGGGYALMLAAAANGARDALRLTDATVHGDAEIDAARRTMSEAQGGINVAVGFTVFFGVIVAVVLLALQVGEGFGGWWIAVVAAWVLIVWMVGRPVKARLRAWLDQPGHQVQTDDTNSDSDAAADVAVTSDPVKDPTAGRIHSLQALRRRLWILLAVIAFALGVLGERTRPGSSRRIPGGAGIGDALPPGLWIVAMLVVVVCALAIAAAVFAEHRARLTQRDWVRDSVADPASERPVEPAVRHYRTQAASLLSRAFALVAMVPLGFGLAAVLLGQVDLGPAFDSYADSEPVFAGHVAAGAAAMAIGLALLALAIRSEIRWRTVGSRLRAQLLERWPAPVGPSRHGVDR